MGLRGVYPEVQTPQKRGRDRKNSIRPPLLRTRVRRRRFPAKPMSGAYLTPRPRDWHGDRPPYARVYPARTQSR
jgi:hypothetical protein